MKTVIFNSSHSLAVLELFEQVFSHSESETEGKLIRNLVSNLIQSTPPQDLIGFLALSGEQVLGSIFFSRFRLANKKRAFILSPVAIATHEQGKGIGQQLINFALQKLKLADVDIVLTYGDPAFYCKVGFKAITEDIIAAPLILSQPEGWLAQSLTSDEIEAIKGATQCVDALNDQQYW